MVFNAVGEIAKKFPGQAIFLDDVDDDLFVTVFYDHAFRLAGAWQVYITPESTAKLKLTHGMTDFAGFTLPPPAMLQSESRRTLTKRSDILCTET